MPVTQSMIKLNHNINVIMNQRQNLAWAAQINSSYIPNVSTHGKFVFCPFVCIAPGWAGKQHWKQRRECEVVNFVLQRRGPVGLVQRQELPVQTQSLLKEKLFHRRAFCSLPPRKTYTTDTHKYGKWIFSEVCLFFSFSQYTDLIFPWGCSEIWPKKDAKYF